MPQGSGTSSLGCEAEELVGPNSPLWPPATEWAVPALISPSEGYETHPQP